MLLFLASLYLLYAGEEYLKCLANYEIRNAGTIILCSVEAAHLKWLLACQFYLGTVSERVCSCALAETEANRATCGLFVGARRLVVSLFTSLQLSFLRAAAQRDFTWCQCTHCTHPCKGSATRLRRRWKSARRWCVWERKESKRERHGKNKAVECGQPQKEEED